jgi:RNA polymerase sigma-70 factor (ECF subfamily)
MSMAGSAALSAELSSAFTAHRREVWLLCYRMTGSAADSDDLVQETFARALERPPRDRNRPWLPWLVRVAINLARDHLRRRRKRVYRGPWLPEPIELPELAHEPLQTEARYELLESVSYAFLVALEALTPAQRAVLLLRDVIGYSASEAAGALGLSEGNVRVVLHRARKALEAYDADRCRPTAALGESTAAALQRFLRSVAAGDVAGVEALLAEGVASVNDVNGKYAAAGVPVLGRNKVARFHVNIARLREFAQRYELRILNGLPALVAEWDTSERNLAPRAVLIPILDSAGAIRAIHTVLTPEKLAHIAPCRAS